MDEFASKRSPVAIWADGFEAELTEITSKDWLEMRRVVLETNMNRTWIQMKTIPVNTTSTTTAIATIIVITATSTQRVLATTHYYSYS